MIRYLSTMSGLLALTMLLVLTGCAAVTRPGTPLYSFGQERKLARAVSLLERNEISTAADLLGAICAEPGVPGVTDEALFRLSLLHLVSGHDVIDQGLARQGLERLRKEYPASSWTPIARAVTKTLAAMDASVSASRATGDDLQQQIKKLKEQISLLNKENRDLHQSIEKLKNLEIELGKGTSH